MQKKEINSVQLWLPFEKILENGIIKLKDNTYIKMIKINPINYNLKSELEKEAIINSYKLFLRTCHFNFQILIQSSKEDLSKHISHLQNQFHLEEKNIQEITKKYIEYIQKLNHSKKSSSKNFYIILKNTDKNQEENYAIEDLNEKYFKIKEAIARCGNIAKDVTQKEEIKNILYSFLNVRRNINDNFNE